MSITINSGGWRRASGPFWHAKKPVLHTDGPVRLKDRGGSPQLVAVYNPARNDFRIKVFADPLIASTIMSVDGRAFMFNVYPDKSLGQARIESDVLWRILQGIDPVDDKPAEDETDPDEPQYLDLSIEAHFSDDGPRWNQMIDGHIRRAPEWLGLTRIACSPAETGGGWHGLLVKISDAIKPAFQNYRSRGGDLPLCLRVNGQWFIAYPVHGLGAGVWMLSGDPLDVRAARDRDPTDPIEPRTEPAPLLDRQSIRRLHKAVRLSSAEYRDGCEAAQTLLTKWNAMCAWEGQADFWRRHLRRLSDELLRKRDMLMARYQKRAKAYEDYSVEKWADEYGDQRWVKPKTWKNRIKDLGDKHIPEAEAKLSDFETKIEEMRVEADAAETVLIELAEKYEDAVRYLFPPR